MRTLLLPILAAAALAVTPAFAALHKCTTKDGKTIYTDGECEGEAKKSEVTIRDSKGVDPAKGAPPLKSSDSKEAPAPDKEGAPPKDAPPPKDGPPPPKKDRKEF